MSVRGSDAGRRGSERKIWCQARDVASGDTACSAELIREMELREAARPFGKVVDEERRPFRANQVGGRSDSAGSAVVHFHHLSLGH